MGNYSSSWRRLALIVVAIEALVGPHPPTTSRITRDVVSWSTTRAPRRLPEIPVSSSGAEDAASHTTLSYWEACAPGERERAERLEQLGTSDMDLVFLGTASCIPSTTRSVSCTALRFQGKTWLFDGGEGSQIMAQRSPQVHAGKVDRIFVTHLHGDHTFGLPGLLCLIGQNKQPHDSPIDVYGPQGLRLYLRASLQLTQSRVAAPYRVHELLDVPLLGPARRDSSRPRLYSAFQADPAFGELPGTDVAPDANGVWHLPGDDAILGVAAAPMVHTVPCVGYVVTERDKPGKLDVDKVRGVLERNYEALKARGVKEPRKVYKLLKEMGRDRVFTFPDGTKIRAEDCVSPPRPGRVVAVCGDTSDASALAPLLKSGCDVLVHEATNAYLGHLFDNKLDERAFRRATAHHGHSTPEMAATFARKVRARRLVLTHFSPRYRGDALPFSLSVMRQIEQVALAARGTQPRCPEDSVIAAWDLAVIPVPPTDAGRGDLGSSD